jgi:large subunit ribosomal protein L18|tara:strand:- start:241028 stop:241393 length:366 start_codon:yes stop_codon:yes gene_type:complete
MAIKETNQQRRARRIRHKIKKINRADLPRLSVHRSGNHMYAQLIDDVQGTTLASASTLDTELRTSLKSTSNKTAAEAVGTLVAKRALAAGQKACVFDRSGFLFHGRIKALADAARAGGMEF